MSYANGTSFLNLPQTVGTDKRDWFDTNEAFADLDAKVKAAYEGSIDTAAALAALAEVVSGISSDVSDLQTTVGNHTTSIGTINEALTLINSTLVALNTTVTGKFDSAGIADPYDAEHGTYDVGDVVTYNGQRYVCHTAVTAAEPFDADKWTAVDIQTELDQINSDLSSKQKIITTDTFTGTTDAYGNINVPTTTIKPSTGVLYGANVPNAFVVIDMNTTYDTFILRVRNNDETMSNLANETITVQIEYTLSD